MHTEKCRVKTFSVYLGLFIYGCLMMLLIKYLSLRSYRIVSMLELVVIYELECRRKALSWYLSGMADKIEEKYPMVTGLRS